MADPISAASLGLAIVAAFKDAYSTIQFIRRTIHTLRHFKSDKSELLTRYEVQVARLELFSLMLSGGRTNEPDASYLKTIPDKYLRLVQKIFGQLQRIFAEYSSFAARQYKKESPNVAADSNLPSKPSAEVRGEGNGEGNGKPARKWFAFLGPSKPSTPSTVFISLHDLDEGVRWLFTKEQMQGIVAGFKSWNDDLKELVPLFLEGFRVNADKKIQNRLKRREGTNIFEGHISLSNLSGEAAAGAGGEASDGLNVTPTSWDQAQAKMTNPRILIEFKKSGMNPKQTSATIESKTVTVQKEKYTPQLARLLRKAGEHDFRTLRLNSYAWDPSHQQCAFLFDYPEAAEDVKPQSLYDLIRSKQPEFELDLGQRFHVARTVARSIGAFHCDGWIHKSIRAQAIKFFNKQGGIWDFSSPYLTDFEISRPDGATTLLEPTALNPDFDVYRHPLRYGLPTVRFNKTHDIYSLGVVLLEIGLWRTAREMHDELVKEKYDGKPPPEGVKANYIRDMLIDNARAGLRHRMGSAYQEAVLLCLNSGLDDLLYSYDFASEFHRQVVEQVDVKSLMSLSFGAVSDQPEQDEPTN